MTTSNLPSLPRTGALTHYGTLHTHKHTQASPGPHTLEELTEWSRQSNQPQPQPPQAQVQAVGSRSASVGANSVISLSRSVPTPLPLLTSRGAEGQEGSSQMNGPSGMRECRAGDGFGCARGWRKWGRKTTAFLCPLDSTLDPKLNNKLGGCGSELFTHRVTHAHTHPVPCQDSQSHTHARTYAAPYQEGSLASALGVSRGPAPASADLSSPAAKSEASPGFPLARTATAPARPAGPAGDMDAGCVSCFLFLVSVLARQWRIVAV